MPETNSESGSDSTPNEKDSERALKLVKNREGEESIENSGKKEPFDVAVFRAALKEMEKLGKNDEKADSEKPSKPVEETGEDVRSPEIEDVQDTGNIGKANEDLKKPDKEKEKADEKIKKYLKSSLMLLFKSINEKRKEGDKVIYLYPFQIGQLVEDIFQATKENNFYKKFLDRVEKGEGELTEEDEKALDDVVDDFWEEEGEEKKEYFEGIKTRTIVFIKENLRILLIDLLEKDEKFKEDLGVTDGKLSLDPKRHKEEFWNSVLSPIYREFTTFQDFNKFFQNIAKKIDKIAQEKNGDLKSLFADDLSGINISEEDRKKMIMHAKEIILNDDKIKEALKNQTGKNEKKNEKPAEAEEENIDFSELIEKEKLNFILEKIGELKKALEEKLESESEKTKQLLLEGGMRSFVEGYVLKKIKVKKEQAEGFVDFLIGETLNK